jgi:beta-lactamase superfamily II metal-dependent hydrolase
LPYQKFFYGRAFTFDEGIIKAKTERKKLGPVIQQLPVLKRPDFVASAKREYEAEDELRKEISELIGSGKIKGVSKERKMPKRRGPKKKISPTVKIIVFYAGQGDTILIEFPGKELWLVDAYFWRDDAYQYLVDFIKENYGKNKRLARFIISHLHYDHIRCASRVVEDLRPSDVVIPDTLLHTTGTARNFLRVAKQMSTVVKLQGPEDIDFGDVDVRLIRTKDFPGNPRLGSDPNKHAIATIIRTEASKALLSGDIPGAMLRALVQNDPYLSSERERYRFYKVTHHCSRTGNDGPFLNTFNPTEAATSCALYNKYNHPHSPPKGVIDRITRGRHRFTFDAAGTSRSLTYPIP